MNDLGPGTENYAELSDEVLMELFRLGEKGAFDELYIRYSKRIYGFLRAKLRDEGMIEDVYQETFMKLYKNRASYNRELPFMPWFFTICRNTMLDAVRKSERIRATIDLASFEPALGTSTGSPPAIADYQLYLDSLSERERKIVELHFVQDLPFNAVSKRLGISSTAARKISSRAINKLKVLFKSHDTSD